MSQDNENKPDEFEFDMNADQTAGGETFASDDFDPFADDAFENQPDSTAADDSPVGGFDFSSFTAETPEDGFVLPEADAEPVADAVPESDALADLPEPSGFLTGDAPETESTGESDEGAVDENVGIVVDAEDGKKKKGKKEKVKKEKKPKAEKKKKEKKKSGDEPEKEAIGTNGIFSLVFGFLLLAGLVAANVFLILKPIEGIGFDSTLYFLIGMDVFGLFAVAVPFLFFLNRKTVDAFKVFLGLSVIAMALGVILLLNVMLRHDFKIKGAVTPNTIGYRG